MDALKFIKNFNRMRAEESISKERAKDRSKTFPGVAKAMAEQWGNLKEEE